MKPTCLLHTWRPHRRRPFALVVHLHQHQSSRNLHLQYLAMNQSTQRCQSLITQGSDHPPSSNHTWSSASPEPELQRARRHDLTAAARWGLLWPSHHHQSTRGEPNHTPTPHVFLLRPPFAAGEPSPAAKGTVVKSRGHMCKPGA
jgi:hypothetical protein